MKILYHCADRVGPSMAGPGIRAVELARRLAAAHAVTLIAPGCSDLQEEPFLAIDADQTADFGSLLTEAEVLVTQGFDFPLGSLRNWQGRLILDLYDPVQLEQLAQFGAAPTPSQRVSLTHVRARLHILLRRADHILCASRVQRALWLGWLGAVGRLTPALLDGDSEAMRFIHIVPFGLPEIPPQPNGHPLREEFRLKDNTKIALWSGGLWDWMDPLLAVHAVAKLKADLPELKLIFLAGARPGGSPLPAASVRTRELVRSLKLEDRVLFYDRWVPYAARGSFLLDADVAVSAHLPSLEAQFAFRTRLLDCLWAQLPVACTAGDALADEAEREGWGRTCAVGDAAGLAAALTRLLQPPAARSARQAATNAAEKYRWDRCVAPLLNSLSRASPPRPTVGWPGEWQGESTLRLLGSTAQKILKRLL